MSNSADNVYKIFPLLEPESVESMQQRLFLVELSKDVLVLSTDQD